MQPLRIVVIQHNAGVERDANLRALDALLAAAPEGDLYVFPEMFAARGNDECLRAAAESLDGPLAAWLSERARNKQAWLLGGGMVERYGGQLFNTAVLLNRNGQRAALYRKMHLFEIRSRQGDTVRESDVFAAGASPALADIEGWRCGLSICYDLRFPELYRRYAKRGMHLLLAPSNFTRRTGRDHWEVLVRARAVENQCFAAAPNLCGVNADTGVASYGNSMIVGPWGEIMARAGDSPGVIAATLDPGRLEAVRRRVPALEHTRSSLL